MEKMKYCIGSKRCIGKSSVNFLKGNNSLCDKHL